MRQLQECAGRIEAADKESCVGPSVDPNFATLVFDGCDVIERHRDPPGVATREERVEPRDLDLPDMSRAVAFAPPDGVAASAHGRRVSPLVFSSIRVVAQISCGKPAEGLRQGSDVGRARLADTHRDTRSRGEVKCNVREQFEASTRFCRAGRPGGRVCGARKWPRNDRYQARDARMPFVGFQLRAVQALAVRHRQFRHGREGDEQRVMPHKLIQTAGPRVRLIHQNMSKMASSATVKLTTKGVYRFTTKAGEDYPWAASMKTVGEDNVLRLTVRVK